jgi:hypothetical protein
MPSTTHDLSEFRFAGRNADGGWGYYPDKSSRLEPHCVGTFALHAPTRRRWAAAPAEVAVKGRFDFWSEQVASPTMRSMACLAGLAGCGVEHASGNTSLLAALQRVRRGTEPSTHSRQDNALPGLVMDCRHVQLGRANRLVLAVLKKWGGKPGAALWMLGG